MVESVTVMLPHSTATDNLNYTSIYNFPAFQSFDEHKISIPFPQQVVHHVHDNEAPATS